MQWPSKFGSRPQELILTTAKLPHCLDTHHRYLGTWKGDEIFCAMEHERKLWRIVQATRKMLDRCLWTLDSTPRTFRCWIRTTSKYRIYTKPLARLQRKKSETRYCKLWMKLLTYIFRVWRLGSKLNQEVYQLSLRPTEEKTMHLIWKLVSKKNSWCQKSGAEEQETDILPR
jgi:hypothetical protein